MTWAKLNRTIDPGARRRQIREVLIYNREDLNRALTLAYEESEKISVLKLASDITLTTNLTIQTGITIIIDGGGTYGFKGDYQINTSADVTFQNLLNYRIGINATGLPLTVKDCRFESGPNQVTAYPAIKVSGTYTASEDNEISLLDIDVNAYTNVIDINGTGMSNVNCDIANIHIWGTTGTYLCDIDATGRVLGITNENNTGAYNVRVNLRGSNCMFMQNNVNLLYSYGGSNSIIGNNWSGGLATSLIDTSVGSGLCILAGNTGITAETKDLSSTCKDLDEGDFNLTKFKNTTGSTLTKGKVVYISGVDGDFPTVSLSDNTTEATSSKTLGVVYEDTPNNERGQIMLMGLLRNVNTSAYSAGQLLYLGTSGNITGTPVSAPSAYVQIGYAVRISATVGSIFVRVLNGFEFDELHDVQITSVAKGDIVVRNGSNLWVNLPVGTNTHVLTADSTTATGVKWAAAGGGGGSPSIGGTITGGTAGSVLFVDPAATIAQDNANLFYDNANNRLGIGTNTPQTALQVLGEARAANFTDGNGNYNVNLGSGNNEGRGLVAGYSGGSYGGIGYNIRHTTTGSTYISPLADTTNYIQFSQGFQFLGDAGTTAGRTTNFTELMRITNTGRVGIGTTSPLQALDVVGSMRLSTGNIYRPDNAGVALILGNGTNTHYGTHLFFNAAGSSERVRITDAGNVGIGTTGPATRLHIANDTGLTIDTVNAQWANFGANVAASNYMQLRRPGSAAALGYIGGGSGGAITAGTSNDLAIRSEGELYLANGNSPSVAITSAGYVGIGTTNPETKLELAGTEPYITLPTELTSASPVNPTTDKLILIGQRIANRGMLSVKGNVGHESALQPYMGHNKVALWSAIPNQATLPTANGISYTTAVGTLTARAVATTNALTYMHRYAIVSTTVAGNITHQRTGTGTTGVGYFFTGNGTTNRGGFVYTVRFAASDATIVVGARMFIGLRNDTAAPTNVAPNTIPNCVGIAQYDGTTQLYIVYGGTSAQAAINLGASFVASNSTPYELALYSPSSATRTIYYEVTNLDTGAIATGTLTGTAVQVPSETLLLTGHHWRTNNATASAVALDICQIYAEMDQ